MPRPKKCRKVACLPNIKGMKPMGVPMQEAIPPINISVEEYEVIRLIDFEGFTQEECALQMEVARTTVTAIYMEARKKIASAIVMGKILSIEGGNFILCPKIRTLKDNKETI